MNKSHRRRDASSTAYRPIEDYAAIGNGSTVALIAPDGSIDWLPLPAHDDPPACAAILDRRRGGRFELLPIEPAEARRRYLPDTNVLETVFTTPSGTVAVTDVLTSDSVALPWTELVRRVEGRAGRVAMRWRLSLRRGWDRQPFAFERRGPALVATGDAPQLSLATFDAGEPCVEGDALEGTFAVAAGASAMLALTAVDDEPLPVPRREEVAARVERTISVWRIWAGGIRNEEGDWSDAVRRSALVLKLLIHARTGAILAAPTTSLPERVGGRLNWDYRYAWLRDSAFTLDALLHVGLVAEAHSSLTWLLRAIRNDAPNLRPFYRLDSSVPGGERELDNWDGYRASRPVRVGNAARGQSQLGNYGDVFETVWRYVRAGNHLDPVDAAMLSGIADHACAVWRSRDSGIWELRGEKRHYTLSKIGCWVALDRAARLAATGEIHCDDPSIWLRERDAIARFVHSKARSADGRTYTMAAGDERLDAALLLAPRTGFPDPEGLLGATVDAIRSQLSAGGPLLYRFTGQQAKEGAFVACSFWLVEALAHLGRVEEAGAQLDAMLATASDLGLFAEEIDPGSRRHLGNFPQGLSHLALINAVAAIEVARRT